MVKYYRIPNKVIQDDTKSKVSMIEDRGTFWYLNPKKFSHAEWNSIASATHTMANQGPL